MSCCFKISRQNIEDPMKWYLDHMSISEQWNYNDNLKSHHIGNVYLSIHEDYFVFEDMANERFFGWDTDVWIKKAGDSELIYGYYSEDTLEAEYIHIFHGKCVREFREYYDEGVIIDDGESPQISNWEDAALIVDAML